MRLDKLLCHMKKGSRSQIKKDLKAGLVTVNGIVVEKPDYNVDEQHDTICYQGVPCLYEKYVYYMLHKPAGVVSATEDKKDKTVTELLRAEGRDDLFPVGRLDKDTEGLLLLTNDGELAHALLSPKRHVEKEYECKLAHHLNELQIEQLQQGVDIGEKQPTRPAKVQVTADGIRLTITEGKYHQVKRMLQAVDNEVTYLKRIRMGSLVLDEQLNKGAYRRLHREEIDKLLECLTERKTND
jgi:16S rRNA pseudouridine516 synthase